MKFKRKYFHPGFKNKQIAITLGILSRGFSFSILFDFSYFFLNLLFRSGFIRAVNYHDIPFKNSSSFENQLIFFKRYFSDVSLQDLDLFFSAGVWKKRKPGLVLSFDDGLRSSYSVVAPLLEKHGFTGWFLIPSDFIEIPPSYQKTYAKKNLIDFQQDFSDDRISLSWEEVIKLDKKHVIVSHTKHHVRLKPGLRKAILIEEIYGSKKHLERKLDHEINCFGWVGGEFSSYDKISADLIQKAGYKYSLMTKSAPILPSTSRYQLNRVFLEADWPISMIKLHVSGILDILYFYHRKKIQRLTLK